MPMQWFMQNSEHSNRKLQWNSDYTEVSEYTIECSIIELDFDQPEGSVNLVWNPKVRSSEIGVA